jgi:tetratricopeptide (TPR) repeat protein
MLNELRLRYERLTPAISSLLSWLSWFNRDRVALLVAALALSMGAILPWYKISPETLKAFDTGLSITNIGRVVAALFACLCFACAIWWEPSRIPRLPIWSGLIGTLLFPYMLTTWSPTIDFIASSLYFQGQAVNIHVKMNANKVQSQWKKNVQLTQSSPISSIFDLSIRHSRFFQFSLWDRILLSGLGFGRPFFAFVGRGWVMTSAGLAIALIAIYLGMQGEAFNYFLRDMSKLLPWSVLLLGILVFSMILPSMINYHLDAMFTRGEYHQVVDTSKALISFYPPVKGDEPFLKRMAEAGYYGKEPDPSLIDFAKGLESYRSKNYQEAEAYFQKSLDIQPESFLVRGYLATTILNEAVNFYNTSYDTDSPNDRKPGAAIDRFEQLLQIFPGHIEALYDLMLARTANDEFEKSAVVAQEIIKAERNAQIPNLSLLGQAYLHSSWNTYQNGDAEQAWKKFRQSTDTSTWGEAEEVEK